MKTCALCKREIPQHLETEHHLIPDYTKLKKKNKETENKKETLHIVCHQKLHSTFTNKELSNQYNTIEKLLENIEIKEFVEWIKKKSIDFYTTNKQTHDRKRKPRYG